MRYSLALGLLFSLTFVTLAQVNVAGLYSDNPVYDFPEHLGVKHKIPGLARLRSIWAQDCPIYVYTFSRIDGGRWSQMATWNDMKSTTRIGLANTYQDDVLMDYLRRRPRGGAHVVYHLGEGQWIRFRVEGFNRTTRVLNNCVGTALFLHVSYRDDSGGSPELPKYGTSMNGTASPEDFKPASFGLDW